MVFENPIPTGAASDAPSPQMIRAAAMARRSARAGRAAQAYADLVTVVPAHSATAPSAAAATVGADVTEQVTAHLTAADATGHHAAPVASASSSAPQYQGSLPARLVCRIIARLTAEMAHMVSERVALRRDRRRIAAHIRQISMYVCHVALRIPHADVAAAFGRDRSTVGHACHFVEDRRDDEAFDAFVSAIERMVIAVFRPCDIAVEGGADA